VSRAAAIVADVRRVIAMLAEIDDPAATRIATAVDRWLGGESLDSALGLVPGWRRHQKLTARAAAVKALVTRFPDLDAATMAKRIVAGRYRDLAQLRDDIGFDQWRRLIAEQREHCNNCNAHENAPPSAPEINERLHGSEIEIRR
jgi:hypothetical protein